MGELTLDGIADLQSYLDALHPDPLAGLRDAPSEEDEEARMAWRRGLREAAEAVEAGPPCWGEPRGSRMFLTDAGLTELVYVALRRHDPVERSEARRIAMAMTAAEYDEFCRALVRTDPRDEVARLLGMEDGPKGRSLTWPEVIVEVATELGRMPHELGPMTLSELRAVRTGGKPREVGVSLAPGKGLRERLAAARAKMFGADSGKVVG